MATVADALFATAPPEALREHARFWSDQFPVGTPGFCDPSQASWSYVESFPLEAFLCEDMHSGMDWTTWFDDEAENFLLDGMDGIVDTMESIVTGPIEQPVVALIKDGVAYLWDGNHRVGGSFKAGRSHISAVVGRPFPCA